MIFKLLIQNIKKRWILYLVALFASILVFGYAVDIVTAPEDEEQIGILVDSVDFEIDYESFTWPDYVKNLQIEAVPDGSMSTIIEARYTIHAFDVFIVSESNIKKYQNYYFELDDTLVKATLGNFDYYVTEDTSKNVGIDITDSMQEYSEDTLTEKYYLCFAKNSLHLGSLNNATLDGALTLAKFIIGEN